MRLVYTPNSASIPGEVPPAHFELETRALYYARHLERLEVLAGPPYGACRHLCADAESCQYMRGRIPSSLSFMFLVVLVVVVVILVVRRLGSRGGRGIFGTERRGSGSAKEQE